MSRKLELEAIRDDKIMSLHGSWVSGGNDEVEFCLSCGAGLSSPYMFMRVERKGIKVREVIDIRPFVQKWVQEIVAEMETPENTEAL